MQNRFAIVYDHQNISGWLKRVQVSDALTPFPESVQVGDLFRGQPIVALAVDPDDFAPLLEDEDALCKCGKQRLTELAPTREWRYYTVFGFYIVNPQYAVSVEEKVAIALLGETQTSRVIGHDDPDALDLECVWSHLSQFETPAGTILQTGPLDGEAASRHRSVDTINTDPSQRQYWRPLPVMLIDNPCPTITVDPVRTAAR